MLFETRIKGIPCQCKVLDYQPYLPTLVYGTGFGDAYPPEEEFFEYEILDLKGYSAPWLTCQIGNQEEAQLLKEFLQHRSEEIYSS